MNDKKKVSKEEFEDRISKESVVYMERIRFSTPKFDNYYLNKDRSGLIARHYDDNTYWIIK